MKINPILLGTLCMGAVVLSSCTKSEDDENATAAGIPESLNTPTSVLNIAMTAIGSVGDGLNASLGGSLHIEDAPQFTSADCDEHAEPKARASDTGYADNSGRLRSTHPRMALQDFYCKMHTDTGAEDSFLGSLSGSEMVICLLNNRLVFDGVAHDVSIPRDEVIACLPEGATEEDKEEMAGPEGTVFTGTITASTPAAFGASDQWDASVKLTLDNGIGLSLLMRDRDDIIAIAKLGGGQPEDGYYVSINRASGEVHYEAKFQRYSIDEDSSSVGWNRHTRIYVKGTLGTDNKFSAVSKVSGIYSDMSREEGGTMSDDIKRGTMWTVNGDDHAVRTGSFELSCSMTDNVRVCQDPNTVASWTALDSSNACNGSLTDTSCSALTVKAMASDTDTQFVMMPNHASFSTTSDWFAALPVASYSDVNFDITQ